jgi:polysaccharide export outer membrane protein
MAFNLSRVHRTVLLTIVLATAPLLAREPQALVSQQGATQPGGAAIGEPPGAQTRPVAQPRGATIAPRDQLTIATLNEPTYTGHFVVDIDGTIQFPNLGRVKASGLTATELEAELKSRLMPDYLVNAQVTVELEQTQNKHVFVTGEVKSPGEYPYAGRISVFQALTRAGSVTADAGEEALIRRASADGTPAPAGAPDGDVVKVDLHDLLNGSSTYDYALQDGDMLIVRPAVPVTVSGAVRSPGQYRIQHGATVQQVVAQAGGISDKGKSSGIKIQRPGVPKAIDVKDWTKEVVRPGDTIIVPVRIL